MIQVLQVLFLKELMELELRPGVREAKANTTFVVSPDMNKSIGFNS